MPEQSPIQAAGLVDIKIPFYAIVRVPAATVNPEFLDGLRTKGNLAAYQSDAVIKALAESGIPARYVGVEDTAYWETEPVEAEPDNLAPALAVPEEPEPSAPVELPEVNVEYLSLTLDAVFLVLEDVWEPFERYLLVYRDSSEVHGYYAKTFATVDAASAFDSNAEVYAMTGTTDSTCASWELYEVHDLVEAREMTVKRVLSLVD